MKYQQLLHGVYRFPSQSARAGKNVTIMGGVHGNERIGVDVLDRLRQALLLPQAARNPATVVNGSLTLIYGNPVAIRTGTRGSVPHADMNRCFRQDLLSGNHESSVYEQQRAQALAPILAQSDVLLDVHSTNKPSDPFIRLAGRQAQRVEHDSQLQQMLRRLPCDIHLLDPNHLLADGQVALTDEYVNIHGGTGICYESGQASAFSSATVDDLERRVWQILEHDTQTVVLDTPTSSVVESTGKRHTYEITQVFKLSQEGFQWADGVGHQNFQCVQAGHPIGYTSPDENPRAFVVDYDAYLIFPKIQSLWNVGSPLGWLAKKTQ